MRSIWRSILRRMPDECYHIGVLDEASTRKLRGVRGDKIGGYNLVPNSLLYADAGYSHCL